MSATAEPPLFPEQRFRFQPGPDPIGTKLNNWHSATAEPPIFPEQKIIDAHHHLWDRSRMAGCVEKSPTHAKYMADDFFDDIVSSGHHIIDTVYVECLSMYNMTSNSVEGTPTEGEVEFAQGAAAQSKSNLYGKDLRCCGGIIGFVDLTQNPTKVGADLDRLIQSGRNFRGIRHSYGFHISKDIPANHHPTRNVEHLLSATNFRAGFQELAKRNLIFDAWGYHFQLDELKSLADDFSKTTIVLNHLGGPLSIGPFTDQRDTIVMSTWKKLLTDLATCQNVYIKLGGVGMPIFGLGLHFHERLLHSASSPSSDELVTAWTAHIHAALECFGPSRCMFESNFPVDKVTCSYNNMWNAFKKIAHAAGLTAEEKNQVFYQTAALVYKINIRHLNVGSRGGSGSDSSNGSGSGSSSSGSNVPGNSSLL